MGLIRTGGFSLLGSKKLLVALSASKIKSWFSKAPLTSFCLYLFPTVMSLMPSFFPSELLGMSNLSSLAGKPSGEMAALSV